MEVDNVIVLSSSDEDECTDKATRASQKIEPDSSFPAYDDFDNFDYGTGDGLAADLDDICDLPLQTSSKSPYLHHQKRFVWKNGFVVTSKTISFPLSNSSFLFSSSLEKARKVHDLSDSDDDNV